MCGWAVKGTPGKRRKACAIHPYRREEKLTEHTATPAELNAEAETVVTAENITENTVERSPRERCDTPHKNAVHTAHAGFS